MASDGESAFAWEVLSAVRGEHGEEGKARFGFLKAIELDPNRVGSMMNLSMTLGAMGQYEEALHWARLALERSPRDRGGYGHIFTPLALMGGREPAERWLRVWKDRVRGDPRQLMSAVLLDATEGKNAQALRSVRALYEKLPRNMEVLMALADLALVEGAPDAEELQRKHYGEKNLHLSYMDWMLLPESPRVRYAYLAAKKGDTAQASAMLADAENAMKQAVKGGVDSALADVEMAALRCLRNDVNGAMEWMQKAYDHGWRIASCSRSDPMLAVLRQDARFQALLKRIDDDLRQMRDNSREMNDLFQKTVALLPPPLAPKGK